MSGGDYEYCANRLEEIAEDIEEKAARDFYGESEWADDGKYDQLQCGPDDAHMRGVIKAEALALMRDLRVIAKRVKAFDYLLCSDYGPESYLEELRKIGNDEQEA